MVSEPEALISTRLYELWIKYQFLDGQFAINLGQVAADTEFLVSQTATLFINSTFGWPTLTRTNPSSGSPAYPFGAPTVRAKHLPTPNLSFQVGLFDGDPAGPALSWYDPDPQRRYRTGTNFRMSDPAFLIAEVAYADNLVERACTGQVLDERGTVTFGEGTISGGSTRSGSTTLAGRLPFPRPRAPRAASAATTACAR